jgi:hypothetical protein
MLIRYKSSVVFKFGDKKNTKNWLRTTENCIIAVTTTVKKLNNILLNETFLNCESQTMGYIFSAPYFERN